MDSDSLAVRVLPDDFLIRSHFEQLWRVAVCTSGGVAGDDDVAIGENLAAAWVLQPVAGEVVVGQRPDDLAIGVEVDYAVSVSAADKRVSVSVSDRGERPTVYLVFGIARCGCVQIAQNLAVAGIVEDGEVEQVWCQVRSVGELAGHPGLHVMVLRLAGERELDHHFAGSADFKQSWIIACFRDDERTVGCGLSTVDLALSAFPDQCFHAVGSDADDGSSTETFRFAQRQNDRTVIQHVAVPGGGRMRPARFSVGSHDVGVLAASKKAVLDPLSTHDVADDAQEECCQ